jgi:peptidyl-prolyl cis-trans isomerase B (cyclophilin B)
MPDTDLVLAVEGTAGFLVIFMSKATAATEVAVLKTSFGEMTIAFWSDVAPATVENFKKLARAGFYDGTAFHRIIKGFMVQGGCPNTKAGETGMPGTGGPGYKIKAEFNPKSHVRGVISMARSSHPDSAGSQFFLVHGDAKFLDRQYTAFGELIAGDDVLERIANVPTKSGGGGEKSTPIDRVALESVKIVLQP